MSYGVSLRGGKTYGSMGYYAALGKTQPQGRVHLVLLQGLKQAVERWLRLAAV